MLAIRRTFEVITPESAEHGDVNRHGWTDAYGYEYASDPAAAPEPEIVTFRELLDLLDGTEPSCAPLPAAGDVSDVWVTQTDPWQDRAFFEAGEDRRDSIHFAGDLRGRRWWSLALRTVHGRRGR